MKFILTFLFFLSTLFASIDILPNTQKIHNFTMGYFYDETRNLSIEKIQNQTFVSSKSQFTYGFKEGDIWFKLNLKNNSSQNEEFILSFSEPYFLDVTFYIKKENGWHADKNGINVPLEKRSILNHNPIFSFNIKKNRNETIYLKMHSELTTSGEVEIYKKSYFNSLVGQYQDLLYMFYFGAIFIVSVISLFLYFRLKENIYLYYSGYTLFYILWVSAYSGHILYLLASSYYHKFLMVTPIFIMFMILFSAQFLNVKKVLPKLYRPLNMFAYAFGVLAILILISFEPWFEVMNALASILFLVLFLVAFLSLRKTDDINTKYYLFAMTIYMVTVSLMSAMVNGWIENNDINRYSFLFGSLFEIMFFSLILTNRFYLAQKELLDVKINNERVLENRIKERTKEINRAYTEVKKLSQERELLLKEVYHRVKNNFHMIIGLLWIEEKNQKKDELKDTFLRIKNRIKSMSLVHQYLYESETLSEVDTKDYFQKIILEIEKGYSRDLIQINKNIDSFLISMDNAISLSMIINEIISNSIKHQPIDKKSKIEVKLFKQENVSTLIIKDNGMGFDTEDTKKGLGLKLIEQFSNKLTNSKYIFINENGAKFELKWKSNTVF